MQIDTKIIWDMQPTMPDAKRRLVDFKETGTCDYFDNMKNCPFFAEKKN